MLERSSGSDIIGWHWRNDVPLEEINGAWTPIPEEWPSDLKVTAPDAWNKLTEEGRNILAPYFPQEKQTPPATEKVPELVAVR